MQSGLFFDWCIFILTFTIFKVLDMIGLQWDIKSWAKTSVTVTVDVMKMCNSQSYWTMNYMLPGLVY